MTKKTKGMLGLAVLLGMALVATEFLLNDGLQNKSSTASKNSPVAQSSTNTTQNSTSQTQTSQPVAAKQPQTPQLFRAGQDYRVLSSPVKTDAKAEKIEVVSIFWYGCPHCYALEPKIEQWQKSLPANVEFIRTPGFFGPNLWQTHARLYYTVRNLGLEQKVHAGIFNEIQNRRNPLKDGKQMAVFLKREFNVEPTTFAKEFQAFGVNNQLQKAFAKLKGYELTGVPAIVIDGRYVVEPKLAGSLDNMPVIADFLVRKVKQDRKG